MAVYCVLVVLALMGYECLGQMTKQFMASSGARHHLRPFHHSQPSALLRPEDDSSAFAMFSGQWSMSPNSVKAECRENSILVEVQQDFFGIGQLIDPSEITLGGCPVVGLDPSAKVLLFESQLQDCGSTLTVTDALIYTFTLVYMPKAIGDTPIVRTNSAVVRIECHYIRKHNVSSNALMPTWIPYLAQKSAEERLTFSLRLMTDDWQLERASNVYTLGDLLNIEASVHAMSSQIFRVFIDSCVATLVPDLMSVPRYAFVENYGCLSDAKMLGSQSQFLPRKEDDKLQLQLHAFRFSQDSRTSIYITCSLKAIVASAPTDAQHKACSFSTTTNRWMEVNGNNQACSCCDASCSFSTGGFASDHRAVTALGPISIKTSNRFP